MSSSGVVGSAGRYALPQAQGPGAADLVLGGARLPLTGTLRVYACGITPYDVTHLGHASTFVWADLLVSLARAVEIRTVASRNVTDIDDVLTAAADGAGRHFDELAATQGFLFERDMLALGVARPDLNPHARGHVTQVIQLVQSLLAVDRAYQVDGTVFFRAAGDPAGVTDLLAGRDREAALASLAEFGDSGPGDGREDPLDVPVWKLSSPEHPAWPSPWGWGRPGWHVECAAMAATVFGASVDVLVGGADLAFPHHAYQQAMVEAVTGVAPFARRHLHVGTVHVDGAKMAKSTGNLVLVRDLLEQVSGPVLRMLLLDRPWADPWEYDAGELRSASDRLDALRAAAGRGDDSPAGRDAVLRALLDDLDVPSALDVAGELGGSAARTAIDVLRLG